MTMDLSERRQRERVVAEARHWLGTPYHSGARLLGVGVDCAQLPAAVYHAAGLIPLIPIGTYSPQWHLNRDEESYLAEVLSHARESAAEPLPGDFILWRVGRKWAHGGIVAGWPRVIHAVSAARVIEADADRDLLCPGHRLAKLPRRLFTLWGDV